jgi:phage baseplate assembly protein W
VSNGNLATSTDFALKTQQIRSVLDTRYYERVMRANYGIDDFVLSVMNPGVINSTIQAAIRQNVDGLTSLQVSGDWESQGDEGVYRVYIEFAVDGVPQPPISLQLAN